MTSNPTQLTALDCFRTEWISSRLDSLRALEALEEARRRWERAFQDSVARPDADEIRRAQDDMDGALRRLEQVRAALADQFDRFCGLSPRVSSAPSVASRSSKSGTPGSGLAPVSRRPAPAAGRSLSERAGDAGARGR